MYQYIFSNMATPSDLKHGTLPRLFFNSMYKGNHMHSHFSGYVPTEMILAMLEKFDWRLQGKEIVVTGEKPVFNNKSRATYQPPFKRAVPINNDLKKVQLMINEAWFDFPEYFQGNVRDGGKKAAGINKFEHSAKVIGRLFFNCIKTPKMYYTYLTLIEKQMEVENVDCLELRLKFGSVRGWSIADEMKALGEFNKKLALRGKFIAYIPQFSRHQDPQAAMGYFRQVAEARKKLGAESYVFSFDLTGSEEQGKFISDFDLIGISELLGPPSMHVGEHPGEKSAENIEALINLSKTVPITRIGHGLNNENSPRLIESIPDAVYECCPLSYLAENVDINYKLIDSVEYITFNTDDCNKLRDLNLNDVFYEMYIKGVSYTKLQKSVLYSIMSSASDNATKMKMLTKFHTGNLGLNFIQHGDEALKVIFVDFGTCLKVGKNVDLTELEIKVNNLLEESFQAACRGRLEVVDICKELATGGYLEIKRNILLGTIVI